MSDPKPVESSSIIVKYNKSSDTAAITDTCEQFTYEDYANGQADTISLQMDNSNKKWLKGYFPVKGDYVACSITTKNWIEKPANGKLYCGRFDIDEISFQGQPSTVTLEGIATPKRQSFSVSQHNKTWKKTTVKTILTDIAKRAGIKLVFDAPDHRVDEESQSSQTDLEFAFNLCETYGINLKIFNSKLVAYDPTKYEKKKPVATIDYNHFIGSYSCQAKITEVYDGVEVEYQLPKKKKKKKKKTQGKTDTKTNTGKDTKDGAKTPAKAPVALARAGSNTRSLSVTVQAKGQQSNSQNSKNQNTKKQAKTANKNTNKTLRYRYVIPGHKGTRILFLSEKCKSVREAEVKGKAALRKELRQSKTMSLSLMGNVKYKSCCNIMIKGWGKFDGKYFIDSVTHTKNRGAYTCDMEIHRVVTNI